MKSYNCEYCGAPIKWIPGSKTIKCDYCGREYDLKEFITFDDQEEPDELQYTESNTEMTVCKCNACGGELMVMNNLLSTTCPYCGSTLAVTNRKENTKAPKYCIPFKFNKEQAKEKMDAWFDDKVLIPNGVEKITMESLQGFYMPYNLVTYTAEGIAQSKYIGKEQNYYIGEFSTKKCPFPASEKFNEEYLFEIGEFSQNYIPYNPIYLAGTTTEMHKDVTNAELADCKEEVTSFIKDNLHPDSKSEYIVREIKEKEQLVETAIMPIWVSTVKYKGKKYMIYMNGETGDITSNLPIDRLKQFYAFLLVLPSVLLVEMGKIIGVSLFQLAAAIISKFMN